MSSRGISHQVRLGSASHLARLYPYRIPTNRRWVATPGAISTPQVDVLVLRLHRGRREAKSCDGQLDEADAA